MNQEQLKQEIESTKGRFFSITFDKKNGETRTINAKTMRSNGGESCSAQAGYVSVYNRNKQSWASVHPNRVKALQCGGIQKTFWGGMVKWCGPCGGGRTQPLKSF